MGYNLKVLKGNTFFATDAQMNTQIIQNTDEYKGITKENRTVFVFLSVLSGKKNYKKEK